MPPRVTDSEETSEDAGGRTGNQSRGKAKGKAKDKKKGKGKRKKEESSSDEHNPIGRGDEEDDNEDGDLAGLDELLNGDTPPRGGSNGGKVAKRPAGKPKGGMKRPAKKEAGRSIRHCVCMSGSAIPVSHRGRQG